MFRTPITITLLLLCSFFVGCSTSYHRQKADEEVYAILSKGEEQVFNRKKNFSIDTSSNQKPLESITNTSLLKRTNSNESIHLTLNKTLEYALANSREYQSRKEQLYLTALTLSDTKQTFAVIPRSSIDSDFVRQSDGDELLNVGGQNTLSKLLKGGGSISLSLANDLLKFFTGSSTRSVTSAIGFNIMQPLLRGRGANIAAERLTQASRNVIYEIRDYAFFQQTFSREIVIDYISLIQQEERVRNQLTNFESRKANYEYLQARSIDRASNSEVAQAKQAMLEAETAYIETQVGYENAEDTFKIQIGMPAGINLSLDPSELDKLVKVGLLRLKYTEQECYQLSLRHRADILNEIDEFEDSRRNVLVTADTLKTTLDFVGNASLQSSGNRWERLNINDLSSSVGFELDLPVNKKRERNNYRRSLINFDSRARSLSQTHDELRNLIKRRFRELEQFRNNYEIEIGAVKLAERRVEENELRLKMGTLIFRRLSESQDDLIRAQNAVTTALVNYQESRLRLYEEIGLLDIEKAEFWLN